MLDILFFKNVSLHNTLTTVFKKNICEKTKVRVFLFHLSGTNSDFPFEVMSFISTSGFGTYIVVLRM